MNDYKITVLLSAYNVQAYIKQAINSILHQTYRNFEIIISDDGSTDNTRDIINSFSDDRIKSYHNSKNKGKTFTINNLYKKSTGSIITVHDADDLSLPDRFECQISTLRQNPEIFMCGTSFIYVKNDLTEFKKVKMPINYDKILQNLKKSSQFHGPTMMIRRNVLDKHEQIYRPYFKDYNEDCDLAYRIAENYKSINLEKYLYLWRIRSDSLSKNLDSRKVNMYKIIVYLANQRAKTGTDDLMNKKEDSVNLYLKTLLRPYKSDSSLIFRESAAFQMYFELYRKAIINSLISIYLNPLKLINYRTAFYCIRKWFLNIVF